MAGCLTLLTSEGLTLGLRCKVQGSGFRDFFFLSVSVLGFKVTGSGS